MITRLTVQNLEEWKQIRLESLQRYPEAFIETPEEFLAKTDRQHCAQLERNDLFGFFDPQDVVVGIVGFYIVSAQKMRHRGNVWGVYVKESHRGKGIAKALLEEMIAHAKSRVTQLHLSVEVENKSALALYEKYGFTIYGTEPKAIQLGTRYCDDYLMVKML